MRRNRDIWRARDAYHVENDLLGVGMLLLASAGVVVLVWLRVLR